MLGRRLRDEFFSAPARLAGIMCLRFVMRGQKNGLEARVLTLARQLRRAAAVEI